MYDTWWGKRSLHGKQLEGAVDNEQEENASMVCTRKEGEKSFSYRKPKRFLEQHRRPRGKSGALIRGGDAWERNRQQVEIPVPIRSFEETTGIYQKESAIRWKKHVSSR